MRQNNSCKVTNCCHLHDKYHHPANAITTYWPCTDHCSANAMSRVLHSVHLHRHLLMPTKSQQKKIYAITSNFNLIICWNMLRALSHCKLTLFCFSGFLLAVAQNLTLRGWCNTNTSALEEDPITTLNYFTTVAVYSDDDDKFWIVKHSINNLEILPMLEKKKFQMGSWFKQTKMSSTVRWQKSCLLLELQAPHLSPHPASFTEER